MKIIFAGTPEFAAKALEALLKTEHEIIAVYTQPDRKAGRGQKITASPVKQLALQHNVPVFQPLHFKSSSEDGLEAQQQLKSLNADVMVVAAYGLILPQVVLDMPKYGCLNIHASLLPRWRGAAPIQRAITAGDEQTGITIMQMAAGLDTGDMLYKTYCPILNEDNVQILHDKLAEQGGEAICEVLKDEKILQNYQEKREVQDDNLSNYAQKITKDEAKIDWEKPALEIHRNIRAFFGWPVAFCQLQNGENLRIWSAELATEDKKNDFKKELVSAQSGEILAVDKSGVWVKCASEDILCLTSVQWAGAKPLNAVQILQTQKLVAGYVLQ